MSVPAKTVRVTIVFLVVVAASAAPGPETSGLTLETKRRQQ